MHREHIPLKFLLGTILLGLMLVLTVGMILSESTVLRVAGALLGVACLTWWLLAPLLDARSSERHVERHPELLRNDAIGEPVIALGRFSPAGRRATGLVVLNGENWRASCAPGHLPEDGEVLSVLGREGLTLIVAPLHD